MKSLALFVLLVWRLWTVFVTNKHGAKAAVNDAPQTRTDH